ncbi:MAG: C25 family cysteine peptidase, partial [Ignavibacteriota bacterium]
LTKIQNNEIKPFGEWNKKYLLFSGGIDPGEYAILKSVNDSIVNKYIAPKPVAGKYTHFYKTISPPSDFGPYSPEEIQKAISSGGLFISYIGHSGTATWDNSINSTNQLYNSVDRNPLITDFGCSTNKYAEPNIVCFGERFLFNSTGQALAYVGNSSLGFQSTALTAPIYFYKEIINDSLSELGSAHLYSKIELLTRNGNTSVNRIYSLTNVILGDPTVRLKIPKLPNFKITASDITETVEQISEDLDSVEFKISIKNLGLSLQGSLEINFTQIFNSSIIKNLNELIPIPDYADTISFWVDTKDRSGLHTLEISLDPNNLLPEIYEDDNITNFTFNVYSSSLRDLLTSIDENSSLKSIRLLNPASYSANVFPIKIQYATEESFIDSNSVIVNADTFFTDINLAGLNQQKRYFIRYKINSSGNSFSGAKSFFNQDSTKYLLIDSISFSKQELNNLRWENDSLRIVPDTVSISVLSAGFNAGATCVISKNGINLLSSTFFTGMGIVVFDDITLAVDTSTWFQLFNQPANVEALANLIDSIPVGKIVALGVADDARNNLSTHLKNSIKSLGSNFIDSLQFRGSWALIGWKGAPTGSVVEMVKPPLPPDAVFIDTNFVSLSDSGLIRTNPIGFASNWGQISIDEYIPSDANTEYITLGIKKSGEIDTIRTLVLTDGIANLSDIDANLYPQIKLSGNLKASSDKQSPKVNKVSIDFTAVPELGLNYQVVETSLDSVYQGNNINLNFAIYNVGESDADSFRVHIDLVKPNNSTRTLLDTLINRLESNVNIKFSLGYVSNINDGHGDFKFKIDIDPTSEILEKYRDNNIFEKSFFVIEDTTITSITELNTTILADGIEIIDGDYVSSKPELTINVKYPIWFPISDTSSVSLFIDNIEIPVSNTQISFDTVNRIISYKLIPDFDNGDHSIIVIGKDKYGNLDYSSAVERYFTTTNELKLLDVYNYPNPFSNTTYFVFNLTQVPDELKIKIYSIAGRLIKEIKLISNELNAGFNKIYFDGKDDDGDLLANGVYLYKVITKKADETVTATNKMAIVK